MRCENGSVETPGESLETPFLHLKANDTRLHFRLVDQLIVPTHGSGLRLALATIAPNGKYWALSTAKLLTDLYVVDGLK